MPRFAANLSMLFTEVPFLDRFERAARSGFEAVEFLFPYAFEAAEIKRRADAAGVKIVLHNLPAGDWDAGERGIACHPDRIDEFRAGVARGVAYAKALGVGQMNCLAGKAPAVASERALHDTFRDNLRYAATAFQVAGLKLLIEPINPFDIPGFFLNRTRQAVALLDEVGAPNAYVQYDIYHAQRTEGELATTIEAFLPRIAHMQLADNPGRHEPGSGEIHWPFLFERIDRLGYDGWIGCEYKPAAGTEAGLGWRDRLGVRAPAATGATR